LPNSAIVLVDRIRPGRFSHIMTKGTATQFLQSPFQPPRSLVSSARHLCGQSANCHAQADASALLNALVRGRSCRTLFGPQQLPGQR
jgi:hypothetical protein